MATDESEIDDRGGAAPARSFVVRAGWLVVGLVCVGVGAVGVIVPGLPTTVFFIAAAASFARCSPRLEAWVLDLPSVGPMVRDYRAGLGMPRRAKRIAIAMIVLAVTISAWVIGRWILSGIVLGAGVVGVIVVLRQPTREHDPAEMDRGGEPSIPT